MVNAEKAGESTSTSGLPASQPSSRRPPPQLKPKPPRLSARPPPPSSSTKPSVALTQLRNANQAQEAEDQAKYELKDSVDGKIMNWKGGKETNLRALIASLDLVLWQELGLQKVGMAELVTPNQVKIRYTKAIAKLHPDKVGDFLFIIVYPPFLCLLSVHSTGWDIVVTYVLFCS